MHKLWIRLRRGLRGDKGITGLETAIILIAFVVVASVFAYTVLAAGIFSSQKGSESVYQGLEEARSSLEIKGSVYGEQDGGTTTIVGEIRLSLTLANKGEPINFTNPTDAGPNGIADAGSTNKVVISIWNNSERYDDITWQYDPQGANDEDILLEQNEIFELLIGCVQGGGTHDLLDTLFTDDLSANEKFWLEIKPPTGSSLLIERTLPDVIDLVNDLN